MMALRYANILSQSTCHGSSKCLFVRVVRSCCLCSSSHLSKLEVCVVWRHLAAVARCFEAVASSTVTLEPLLFCSSTEAVMSVLQLLCTNQYAMMQSTQMHAFGCSLLARGVFAYAL
jgi:hypothetical protein